MTAAPVQAAAPPAIPEREKPNPLAGFGGGALTPGQWNPTAVHAASNSAQTSGVAHVDAPAPATNWGENDTPNSDNVVDTLFTVQNDF